MGSATSSLAPCGSNGGQMTWRAGSQTSWRPANEDSATSQSAFVHHHQGFFTTKPCSFGSSGDPLTPLVTTSTSTMPSTTTSASRSKLFGLATLRRKVMAIPSKMRKAAGGLGRSQSREHARTIRALLSNWSVHEIHALVEEYETLMTIRDLTIEAEIARHVAPSVSEDLARLFDQKICTDTEIVFKGVTFPVHRAILSARCRYFRELFSSPSSSSSSVSSSPYVIPLTPHLADLSVPLFSSLLRFLYCGEFKANVDGGGLGVDCATPSADVTSGPTIADETEALILTRLAEEFGSPNPLELDLQSLFGHGLNADAMLVFTASGESVSSLSPSTSDLDAVGSGAGTSSPPPSRRPTTTPSTPTQPKFFLNLQSPPISPSSTSTNRSILTSPGGGGGANDASSMAGSTPTPLVTQPVALLCHRAILSVRSPFFKSIVKRRIKAKEEANESVADVLQILLDEKVIPRKYASIIMEAIYTDKVDLSKITATSPTGGNCNHVSSVVHPSSLGSGSSSSNNSGGSNGGGNNNNNIVVSNSLKEATAISAGKGQHSPLDDAMELYQIAQFIDLEILSQNCEDIIVSHLSLDNLLKILSWSSEPHGSTWVKRQCLRFLREEFAAVANASPPTILMELSEEDMVALLESDFLQASEQDILGGVLKWSEHQLVRRVEEREPNLVSGTTHSVTRRGLRRRDVNDAELRDIASPLMALVRIAHVLPPNSETLQLAQRRGLLSTPPAHLFGPDSVSSPPPSSVPTAGFINSSNNGGSSSNGGAYAPAAGVFTGSYHPQHQHPQQHHHPHHQHPFGPQYAHSHHHTHHQYGSQDVLGGGGNDLIVAARLHSTMSAMTPRCYGGGGGNGSRGSSIAASSSTSATTHHAKTTPPNHPASNAAAASAAAATNALSSSSAAWLTRFPRFPPSSNAVSTSQQQRGGPAGLGYHRQSSAAAAAAAGSLVDNAVSLKPRLFFPYFDEAKTVLQEQLVDLQEDLEVVRLRMLRCCMSHHFPDTLYMVSPMMGNHDATGKSIDSNTLSRMDPCEPGVVANSELFIPECDVMLKLLNRMMTLSLHPLTQRALSMLSSTLCNAPCNNVTNVGLSSYSSSSSSGASRAESMSGRNSVFHLLQLRAIRECGLPDQVIHVLKTPALYYPDNVDVLEASKQLNSVISAPNRRDGPPGWGPIKPNSTSADTSPYDPRSHGNSVVGGNGGVNFLPASTITSNGGRTSYVDAAHASISPSSSHTDRVPADFPASLLDPWSGGLDLPVVDGDVAFDRQRHHSHQHQQQQQQQQNRPRSRRQSSSSRLHSNVVECEDDVNGLEGAVGGVDLFNYAAVPDLTMGTLPSPRPASIEVVSIGTSTSSGPSSPGHPQQQPGNTLGHGSMNRFHITHFGGLMPPASTSSPTHDAEVKTIVKADHDEENIEMSTRCELSVADSSSSSSSFPAPFLHAPPSFLPVTPQAPVSPRHQFHHHQHTCNHHANPNLLIPSSNCLFKMNRLGSGGGVVGAGDASASSVATVVSLCAPRSSFSSSSSSPVGQSCFPPDIALGSSGSSNAGSSSATTPLQQQQHHQLQSYLSSSPPFSSTFQPPPLDILPPFYHAQSNLQGGEASAAASAAAAATARIMPLSTPDVHNHQPCPHQQQQRTYDEVPYFSSSSASIHHQQQQQQPICSDSFAGATSSYSVSCHGGGILASHEGGESVGSSSASLSMSTSSEHQNMAAGGGCGGRGRSHQRRGRQSVGSPSSENGAGGVGGAGGVPAVAVHHHFFERTSVSLVRRAPSQRRQDDAETEDVAIDEEGLFV